MLKLMKLEIIKFKINGYIKGAVIANLIILAFLFMIVFGSKVVMATMFDNYNYIVLLTGSFVRATFSIYAAVLLSKIVIGEFNSKTINILFAYPINRKKIMVAKFMIVVIFTFASILLSSLFLNTSLIILNGFVHFIEEPLTQGVLVKNLIDIVMYSAAFAFISLIPVYVGMKRKSGSSTIVTSVILVSLLNSGINGNNLSSIIIIPIILGIVGAVVAYLSIKDIEKVDVINF